MAIKESSYSIYLKVKLNNLYKRLKSSKKRPLLDKNTDNKEILKNLYNERQKFYIKADFTVSNDDNKFQVLEKIKFQLNVNEN